MTDFHPKFDNVVISEIKAPGKSRGGIILPKDVNTDEECRRGKIEDIGPGRYYDGVMVETTHEVGDLITFEPHAGFTVMIGKGKKASQYVIIREMKILGTYEE